MLIINCLGNNIAAFSNKMLVLCIFNNVLIVIMGITAFDIFNCKRWFSKTTNYISSTSLIIYLISENILFKENIKPVFWKYIHDVFTFKFSSLWTIFFAIIYFVVCLFIASVYKSTLQIVLYKVSDYIFDKIKRKANKCIDIIENID
jgi:hypothetical protein